MKAQHADIDSEGSTACGEDRQGTRLLLYPGEVSDRGSFRYV